MEYTVQNLGKLAGVSTRTLRYYDEIDILKPARINSSGYRIYGQAEVDRLQQILFYRELGVSLDRIKEIVTASSFNGATALKEHREQLLLGIDEEERAGHAAPDELAERARERRDAAVSTDSEA